MLWEQETRTPSGSTKYFWNYSINTAPSRLQAHYLRESVETMIYRFIQRHGEA